jgi:UDP-N-acetylmuramate--alanine ligase
LVPKVKKRYITYGLSAQADVTAHNITSLGWGYGFELVNKGKVLTKVNVNLPGRHNVLNALAAAAVGLELGLEPQIISEGIAGLKGVGRRFELKGEPNGITFLDDYGHHPTEIRATLSALRESFPGRRCIVLFQPHRHSRTKDLFEEFVSAFNEVEKLYLLDIYAAGEKEEEGINASVLAEAIKDHGHRGVEYLGALSGAADKIIGKLTKGDVFMTLGAGNVVQAGEELVRRLSKAGAN